MDKEHWEEGPEAESGQAEASTGGGAVAAGPCHDEAADVGERCVEPRPAAVSVRSPEQSKEKVKVKESTKKVDNRGMTAGSSHGHRGDATVHRVRDFHFHSATLGVIF